MPIMNCLSCKEIHILWSVLQKDFSFTNWSFFQNLKYPQQGPNCEIGIIRP
jgi:hypothetical protein